MIIERQCDIEPEVGAIITAMTDAEKPFIYDTIRAVLSDTLIGQAVLCIEEKNSWIDSVIGSFMTDPRLELIRMPLVPLGAVRNQALKYIKKPWVTYCDGDDVWCQGKTMNQLDYASVTGADFVGSDHYLTNEKGDIRALSPARYIPVPSSWMVKTEIMRQHSFIETPYSIRSEDDEWWIRTYKSVNKVRCPKMLVKYRVRDNSLSSATISKRRKARIVSLGNIPVLGAFFLLLTWCIWVLTRNDKYVWYKGWNPIESTD